MRRNRVCRHRYKKKKPPYRSSKKRTLTKIDGDQSLFFFGLVNGVHARASVEAMRRAKRGRQPEKNKAPLPFHSTDREKRETVLSLYLNEIRHLVRLGFWEENANNWKEIHQPVKLKPRDLLTLTIYCVTFEILATRATMVGARELIIDYE